MLIKIDKSKQTVFKLFFQRAAEFRRRFAMARPYPRCGHAVARRAKVVSGGSRGIRCRSLLPGSLRVLCAFVVKFLRDLVITSEVSPTAKMEYVR